MNDQNPNELWSHLHWLTVLAQHGSYTAAAARLGVSKAAMSQHMAELERQAGVALVRRTTRSVQLTEAGQRLVDDTRAQFEHIAQSFAQARDLAGAPRGLLRVTAPVAFARQQLVPLLADFLHRFPEVQLALDLSDRLTTTTDGFDLAIRHTAAPPDTHVAWTLCATHSVLVASPSYLRQRGTPATPHELVAHNCLHYPRAQDAPVWAFEPLGEHGEPAAKMAEKAEQATGASGEKMEKGSPALERVSIPVSGSLSANNSEALRDAALTGLGIALLPDFSAQASLRAGTLVQVLPRWRPVGAFAEQLYAIRPYSAHVPRAVTAFVAYLREALGAGFIRTEHEHPQPRVAIPNLIRARNDSSASEIGGG